MGADLHADGTVSVGHWPDGEDWEGLVRTAGVPDPCAPGTAALAAEPVYTRAQIVQAVTAVCAQARSVDPAALGAWADHVLAALTPHTD